ncbi:MAG: hypothetical protein K0U86_22720 [Planctomycetes bacterium]|nr:hypothetical protein [Planctomycetota bacterium]MCH9727724.1 hypothetical protein [Planctomycetota bacterium]MCH9776951.1 hypothetical protein [Planctomycetota bacterium]MCH9792484.1 hypothetical protein [Planctomycetota bacterium]
MDKLKPIIVHKFWIILFIALLLPVVGWSMATGSLSKEIDERKSAIDKAFTDAQVPPNPPNQTWSTALQQINKEKDQYIGQSHKKLWENQKSLFIWPANIAPLMKNTPYRGEISRVPKTQYRTAYRFEILRAHKLAKPFSLRDGTGTVDINPNVIPHVPLDKWKTQNPTSKEMWDAQEDVWLVSSILQAISEVNKGATNIGESAVRQISVLELRGGTFGEESGDSGGGGDGDSAMDDMGGVGGFGGGGGGGRRAADDGKDGMQNIDIEMDLTEIFGNDADTSESEDDGSGESAEADGAIIPGGFGGGSGRGASAKRKRYYQEAEELPYKTRAFYIKAVIQSGKLPNLLTELTNMPWPAEIVRVQRADLFDDNLGSIANIGGLGGRRGGGESDFSVDGLVGGAGSGRSGRFGGIDSVSEGFSSDSQSEGLENKGLLDAALSDPKLALVTIAGVMTLYKPYEPPEGEAVAETEGDENNSQQPAADGTTQPTEAASTPETGESSANTNPAAAAPNSLPEKQPAPAGDNLQQPTESTDPKQPAETKPDPKQPPKTESKSEETINK